MSVFLLRRGAIYETGKKSQQTPHNRVVQQLLNFLSLSVRPLQHGSARSSDECHIKIYQLGS